MKQKKRAEELYDLIVIGGGPAGMMAAGTAAKDGKKVLLLEKNKDLGEKLKITGGGRCNITNYELDNRKLLKHYGEAEPFLYSPFSQFSVKETFTFFEKKKLPLVIQARNRVFPKSERAYDVYLVLKKFLKKHGVKILLNTPVTKIHTNQGEIQSVESKGKRYFARHYIIATGGVSAPETGSTGDGFIWLKKMGHTVHKPSPDIVPLRVHDTWVKKIPGTKLSFMKITFFLNGEKQFSKKGKILFTHFGISSPTILNISKKVKKLLDRGSVRAEIDLFPDTNLGALEKRVLKLFEQHKNKHIENTLKELVTEKLIPIILIKSRIPFDKKVHSIKREERKQLIHTLKHIDFEIAGLMGMDRAVIADGGIPLTEVDTKTMQSKKVKNLSLTGDILHINRPSGGYSLQLCWTTGYVAGKHTPPQEKTRG